MGEGMNVQHNERRYRVQALKEKDSLSITEVDQLEAFLRNSLDMSSFPVHLTKQELQELFLKEDLTQYSIYEIKEQG